MVDKFQIKNIEDLLNSSTDKEKIRRIINCVTIDNTIAEDQLSVPLSLNAFVVILVLSGSGTIHINYKPDRIESGKIVLLSASHLFKLENCSSDFKCLSLLVSKKFMDDMDATEMIYRRIKYGSMMYNRPVVEIKENNVSVIESRIRAIDETIKNEDHLYYKDLILNHLFAFYLDLSNIIERDEDLYQDGNFTRYEGIIKSFIELLIKNYKTEHKVEFYSSQLNITPHYLTLIVKRITGQTVSDFIFEMLYSEARSLLTHSQMSIQEIASYLNLSDQSAFGKFFKRKSGVSPKDYRRRIQSKLD